MKKAMINQVVIWMILVFVILVAVAVAVKWTGVVGSDMDSLTGKADKCTPKNIGVRVTGKLDVTDTKFFGVQPEPTKISVDQVQPYNSLGILDGITSTDYDWEVCLINTRTNNKISCDSGKDTHPGGEKNVQSKSYVLDFTIPDNNCDGIIDDFDTILEAKVNEDETEHTLRKVLNFRNGKWELEQ